MDNLRVIADMVLYTHFGEHYHIRPAFVFSDGEIIHEDDIAEQVEMRFRLARAADEPYTVELEVYEERLDFIIVKSIVFPMINLLWAGIVILLAGLWMAWRARIRTARGKM